MLQYPLHEFHAKLTIRKGLQTERDGGGGGGVINIESRQSVSSDFSRENL